MPKTVVGLFNSTSVAQTAVRELERAGFGKDHLRTISRARPFESAYAVDADEVTPDYFTRQGVPPDEAAFYVDGVGRGGSLVLAHIQDQDAAAAAEIMARHAPADFEPLPDVQPEPEPDRIETAPQPEPEGVVVEEHRTRTAEAPGEAEGEVRVETERVAEVEDVSGVGRTSAADEDVSREDVHLASSVTVAETPDVQAPAFEDDRYASADEGDYAETDVGEDDERDEEEADVGDELDEEELYADGAFDDVAWLDEPASDPGLTERLVAALLEDLRGRIARLEERANDQAERLARLEERAGRATERAEHAAELSAAKLETQLVERLTRLEALHRRGLPPEEADRPLT